MDSFRRVADAAQTYDNGLLFAEEAIGLDNIWGRVVYLSRTPKNLSDEDVHLMLDILDLMHAEEYSLNGIGWVVRKYLTNFKQLCYYKQATFII